MRYIILAVFLFLSISLHAQYEKGKWYLSGSSFIEAGNQSTIAGGAFQLESASRSGYFLFDRLLVGGNVLTNVAP